VSGWRATSGVYKSVEDLSDIVVLCLLLLLLQHDRLQRVVQGLIVHLSHRPPLAAIW